MSHEIRDGKTVWWLYQARRINTQDNAGGGALRTRISIPAGTVAKLVSMVAVGTASAGASLVVYVADEDVAALTNLGECAAGASRVLYLPNNGGAASTHNAAASSVGLILGPGQYLYAHSSAALQTETQTIGVVLLLSTPTAPTWDTTGSAGTPNLAASTISAANTLQAVVM